MSEDNVQVALRIRPLVKSERERGCQEAVERVANAQQVIVNRIDTFTFNYVFDSNDTQEDVYRATVSPMLDKLLRGFNATILAYGQTGSGKTHTMGTAYDGVLDDTVGVIPRAMKDIFQRIADLAGEYAFVLTCSFMELYQEQLYDLLSRKSREESVVELRENKNGIIIPDLTEEIVCSAHETFDCLVRGSGGRAVASTSMNQQSSRSHAIFTLTIEATRNDELKTVTSSKFHLVDLAGSERSKKTQATGDRFKEGVKINQGLLALGNVISALGSGQGSGFVRYRDSKLTRLLQDSLGGNSITLMIACVSPADYNVAETLSTLRYADRARKIKNKPIVNQDPHIAEINHLKSIIQKLRMELLAAGGNITSSINGALQQVPSLANAGPGDCNKSITVQETRGKIYQELQEKYHNLQQQLQVTLHDVAENEMRAHIAEVAHENLKAKTDQVKTIVSELSREFRQDATTDQLKEHIKSVQQIHQLVNDLDEELLRTQTEITDHKRRCSISSSRTRSAVGDEDGDADEDEMASARASLEVQALMQEQTDAYTSKQINIKEELRRINRELDLKEELQHRIAGNLSKFCSLEDNVEHKFRECEEKIQELEAEKSQLLDKLKHVKENASAKLAEERRKRLQTLEQEISAMKRTNIQQAKLLKVREKETQKIKNLSGEIQAMKESKVRLIRAMRLESENFRQWKLTREKELMQLKNKDRKLQNEMVRKEALHTKQRNVLKRKCEEAMAINKRLKDALERQKVAQSHRKMYQAKDASAATSKVDQVIACVERELEVILSLIDAEHSLEQLLEDRGVISSRIGDLKQEQGTATTERSATISEELLNLEEELEMRNAQITDLQQKICVADLDSRMASLCESIQNMGEARAVLKHLLKSISEMRREYANKTLEQKTTLDEMCAMRDAAQERCDALTKRLRLIELEHEEAIAERENTYEDKIAVLLRELQKQPLLDVGSTLTPEQQERLQIQEEQLNKMDTLRAELEYYKQMVNDLQVAVKAKTKSRSKYSEPVEQNFLLSEDDDIYVNSSDDPDWRKTPYVRKVKRRLNNTKHSNSDVSSVSSSNVAVDKNTTADNAEGNNNKHLANGRAARESSESVGASEIKRKPKGCSCRGNCSNKRCGCYSNAEKCSLNCRCSASCNNGKNDPKEDDNGACDGTASGTVSQNTNFKSPKKNSADGPSKKRRDLTNFNNVLDSTLLTPKVARSSTISFDSTVAKRKFFD